MLREKDFDTESLNSFPILVEEATSKRKFVAFSPRDIPEGVEVKVIEINYVEERFSNVKTIEAI